MDQDQIIDLFLSNYSDRDITKMLLERMSKEEIDKELESFQAIKNESDPSKN